MHTTGAYHLLVDTTYCTGTHCNTQDSLHTAGTLMGGANKAGMLQNNFLQRYAYHSSLDMLVVPYPYLDCIPLSGHTGSTNTLVPVKRAYPQLRDKLAHACTCQENCSTTGTITQAPTGLTGHCQVQYTTSPVNTAYQRLVSGQKHAGYLCYTKNKLPVPPASLLCWEHFRQCLLALTGLPEHHQLS